MSESYKIYASKDYVDSKLPSTDKVHQQLVTDGNENIVWEDKLAYYIRKAPENPTPIYGPVEYNDEFTGEKGSLYASNYVGVELVTVINDEIIVPLTYSFTESNEGAVKYYYFSNEYIKITEMRANSTSGYRWIGAVNYTKPFTCAIYRAYDILPEVKTIDDIFIPDTIARKNEVNAAVANLVNSAPETLDTLGELATALQENNEVIDALNSAIGNKVDKIDGKGLSTNDFTNEEKNKLATINEVPACTTNDNDKFLRVVNGVATWTAVSNAEEVSF